MRDGVKKIATCGELRLCMRTCRVYGACQRRKERLRGRLQPIGGQREEEAQQRAVIRKDIQSARDFARRRPSAPRRVLWAELRGHSAGEKSKEQRDGEEERRGERD